LFYLFGVGNKLSVSVVVLPPSLNSILGIDDFGNVISRFSVIQLLTMLAVFARISRANATALTFTGTFVTKRLPFGLTTFIALMTFVFCIEKGNGNILTVPMETALPQDPGGCKCPIATVL
jgi:hypothetical protein